MIAELLTPGVVRRIAGTCAVIVSLAIWFVNHRNSRETQAVDLLVAGATGAAFPNIFLMFFAIDDPNIYLKFPDLTTLGAIGGVAILHTSYKGLKKYFVPHERHAQEQALDR